MDIERYKEEMRGLAVNRKGRRVAPHKAVLLMAVVDLIESGEVDTPFVPITQALERAFKVIWRRYVPEDSPFSCGLNYPFYHLSSSPFWQLVKLPTYEERDTYSMAALKRSFAGAVLSPDLFEMLRDAKVREEVRRVLVENYLSGGHDGGMDLKSLAILIAAALLVA